MADYQTLNGGPADNVADKATFVTQWVALVTKIMQDAPEVQGKLLLDLINEPDRCGGLPGTDPFNSVNPCNPESILANTWVHSCIPQC